MERNNAAEPPGGDFEHGGPAPRPGEVRRPRRGEGGFLTQYKPEQGKVTRTGTFIGAGLIIAWGALSLNNYLSVFAEEGAEWWRQLIAPGIPFAVAIVLGTIVWRLSFVLPKSSDFMIATEGEMKKVNWSSRREVIGSTKVVIVFVLLMGIVLFLVDLLFQWLFTQIGVLKL